MQINKVILIDDEKEVRLSWGQTLELEGFDVVTSGVPQSLPDRITRNWPGVVLSDVKMPGIDGMNLLKRIRDIDAELPVVLFTGHGDISMAIQAIRDGAYDFVEKTAPPEYLIDVVRRALEKRRLVIENRELRRELDELADLEGRLIGKTAVMEKLRTTIHQIADTNVDILIVGETGSGKELVTRCLHDLSPRCKGPFVAINCAAMPETIFESELFGYEPGAFTGATQRRIGKIEYAHGGTLFLDEVESMPLQLQVKLLRVLQERCIERLGSNQTHAVDIRVVAATKVDLHAACRQNRFREDLFYRLNVVTIALPPLRERMADIPLLYEYFIGQACDQHRRNRPTVSPEQSERLLRHDWPGNVRELKNAAERFVLGIENGANDVDLETTAPLQKAGLADQMEQFEKHLVAQALRTHRGRINATAAALGITRKTLYLRIRKFGLDKFDFR
jgi:two-component system, NtrC family, C4-dicarboxylate transport response regulator DctD